MAAQNLAMDSFWVDKSKFDEAETQYYERLANVTLTPLADEVAKARQRLIEIRGNVEDGNANNTQQLLFNEAVGNIVDTATALFLEPNKNPKEMQSHLFKEAVGSTADIATAIIAPSQNFKVNFNIETKPEATSLPSNIEENLESLVADMPPKIESMTISQLSAVQESLIKDDNPEIAIAVQPVVESIDIKNINIEEPEFEKIIDQVIVQPKVECLVQPLIETITVQPELTMIADFKPKIDEIKPVQPEIVQNPAGIIDHMFEAVSQCKLEPVKLGVIEKKDQPIEAIGNIVIDIPKAVVSECKENIAKEQQEVKEAVANIVDTAFIIDPNQNVVMSLECLATVQPEVELEVSCKKETPPTPTNVQPAKAAEICKKESTPVPTVAQPVKPEVEVCCKKEAAPTPANQPAKPVEAEVCKKEAAPAVVQPVKPIEMETCKKGKAPTPAQPAKPVEAEVCKKEKSPAVAQLAKPVEPEVCKKEKSPAVAQPAKPLEPEVCKKEKSPAVTQPAKPLEPEVCKKEKSPAVAQPAKPLEPEVCKKEKSPAVAQPAKPVEPEVCKKEKAQLAKPAEAEVCKKEKAPAPAKPVEAEVCKKEKTPTPPVAKPTEAEVCKKETAPTAEVIQPVKQVEAVPGKKDHKKDNKKGAQPAQHNKKVEQEQQQQQQHSSKKGKKGQQHAQQQAQQQASVQPNKNVEPVVENKASEPTVQPDKKVEPVKETVAPAQKTQSNKPEAPKKGAEALISDGSSIDTGYIKFLEKKINEFQNVISKIQNQFNAFDARLASVENCVSGSTPACKMPAPACKLPGPPAKKAEPEDDDDVDLFGSESEDDEAAAKIKEERLAAYNAKKSKKPVLIAKSSIILDIKPWDDETDMKAMEVEVRKIVMEGLLWGASKLVPLAYGIHKLQINCVVEDDKVSIDALQEQIESIEDFVQSVDIAAFNKI